MRKKLAHARVPPPTRVRNVSLTLPLLLLPLLSRRLRRPHLHPHKTLRLSRRITSLNLLSLRGAGEARCHLQLPLLRQIDPRGIRESL